jgi:hypothetical protein
MKQISIEDIEKYIPQAKKEGILFSQNCTYYGIYEGENLAGFCAVKISGKRGILKCAYVLPRYRRRNLYSTMTLSRLYFLQQQGCEIVEANCTKMSIGLMLKLGAKIVKKYKNGITQIRFENIS